MTCIFSKIQYLNKLFGENQKVTIVNQQLQHNFENYNNLARIDKSTIIDNTYDVEKLFFLEIIVQGFASHPSQPFNHILKKEEYLEKIFGKTRHTYF